MSDIYYPRSGDRVYWNDPDDDISSGDYTIYAVAADPEYGPSGDTIVLIQNDAGSEAEVLLCELESAGCGAEGPEGYCCTHHSATDHIARGTVPLGFGAAWQRNTVASKALGD